MLLVAEGTVRDGGGEILPFPTRRCITELNLSIRQILLAVRALYKNIQQSILRGGLENTLAFHMRCLPA